MQHEPAPVTRKEAKIPGVFSGRYPQTKPKRRRKKSSKRAQKGPNPKYAYTVEVRILSRSAPT